MEWVGCCLFGEYLSLIYRPQTIHSLVCLLSLLIPRPVSFNIKLQFIFISATPLEETNPPQNLSQFLIIGRMSALTFNVASNVKTIIILTYGWISEGRVLTAVDALGIILALGGATFYSQLSKR